MTKKAKNVCLPLWRQQKSWNVDMDVAYGHNSILSGGLSAHVYFDISWWRVFTFCLRYPSINDVTSYWKRRSLPPPWLHMSGKWQPHKTVIFVVVICLQFGLDNNYRGVSSYLKLSGQVVMRRAAAARQRLLFYQNLGGQLPTLPTRHLSDKKIV